MLRTLVTERSPKVYSRACQLWIGRTLLHAFGIASVTPLLSASATQPGKITVAKPGESLFPFSTASQSKLSPCKLTSEISGGSCSAFEPRANPQAGPYLHVHHGLDEWYYVLSGEFLFKAGDESHTLPTGASIWLPRCPARLGQHQRQ